MMSRLTVLFVLLASLPAAAQDAASLQRIRDVYDAVQKSVAARGLRVHRLGTEQIVPAVGPQTRIYKLWLDESGRLRKLTLGFDVAASAMVTESFWLSETGALVFHYQKVESPEDCPRRGALEDAVTETRSYLHDGRIIRVKTAMRGAKDADPDCDEWFRGKSETRAGGPQDRKTARRLIRAAEGYRAAGKALHQGKGKTAAIAAIRAGEG